tara:strand:- start:803 stop:1654 length:852 start_codon:yes stop_codon:yes gene_type:complete
MNNNQRISIMVPTRERPSELGLLLQSLRTQTYQKFDIFIMDDCSGSPLNQYHFLQCLIARLKMEGHKVFMRRNQFMLGVSKVRQAMCDWVLAANNNPLLCRLDDDIILEPDYLEKLFSGIEKGYDLVSGLTPPIMNQEIIRENRFVKPFINDVILDKEGNILKNGDDCGYCYEDSELIPTPHFRSTALYKREIHEKVDYKSRLSHHGYREEQIFSFKCLQNGFKLGVHTGAIVYHLLTPSGGERFSDQNQLIAFNEGILKDWTAGQFEMKGDFIQKWKDEVAQ